MKAFAACILFIGSTHAQVSNQTTPGPKLLVVNGRSVKAKVLEISGKHFVSVEDLAQSLGGSVAYADKQITLTFLLPTTSEGSASEAGGSTDPKLTGVRSAAVELRSAVDTGVTYAHYMEKLQHFAAEISLPEFHLICDKWPGSFDRL